MIPTARMATKKLVFHKKIKVGNDPDSPHKPIPVYLECELRETDLSTEAIYNGQGKLLRTHNWKYTTDHKKIVKYVELSICAQSKYFCGQSIDTLKRMIEQDPRLKRIVALWEAWHLNDMQPNCIHQTAFDCNVNNYDELSAKETAKCPKKYKYGSAWLVRPLPQEIQNEIMELFTNWKVTL